MAGTARYKYFAIIDKPIHPENPGKKPFRGTKVYINTTGGTDPKTGELIRPQCKGLDPTDRGIYVVDLESEHGDLKEKAMMRAVRNSDEGRSDEKIIGPFDSYSKAVMEQTALRPLTDKEKIAKLEAENKALKMGQREKGE